MGTNKCASQSGMTAYGTRRHLYDPKTQTDKPYDQTTISLQMGTNKGASQVCHCMSLYHRFHYRQTVWSPPSSLQWCLHLDTFWQIMLTLWIAWFSSAAVDNHVPWSRLSDRGAMDQWHFRITFITSDATLVSFTFSFQWTLAVWVQDDVVLSIKHANWA